MHILPCLYNEYMEYIYIIMFSFKKLEYLRVINNEILKSFQLMTKHFKNNKAFKQVMLEGATLIFMTMQFLSAFST